MVKLSKFRNECGEYKQYKLLLWVLLYWTVISEGIEANIFFFLNSNIKFIYRFNIKDNPLTLAGKIR